MGWVSGASDGGNVVGIGCAVGNDCFVERSAGGAESTGIAGRNNCGAGSTNGGITLAGLMPDQSARRKTTHA
ncbi:hypothetical protein ACMZ8K_03770 [Gardnerella swidsinskii]|uniref:hypothetical protein n=1 Tax=Gardnerella swidsinskii TaxID=2792979 RepID=UPI0039EE01B7